MLIIKVLPHVVLCKMAFFSLNTQFLDTQYGQLTILGLLPFSLRKHHSKMCVNTPIKAFVSEHLAEIDLAENRLGEYGIKALASMLLENTSLISLNLSGNHLDEQAAKQLAPALTKNQHLQHLDLSHNRLGEAAGTA